MTRAAAIPLILDMVVAIRSTKVPILLGHWSLDAALHRRLTGAAREA